jgi:hypothetical protein
MTAYPISQINYGKISKFVAENQFQSKEYQIMLRILIISVILTCIGFNIQAQQVSIGGKVIDTTSGKGVENAVVDRKSVV